MHNVYLCSSVLKDLATKNSTKSVTRINDSHHMKKIWRDKISTKLKSNPIGSPGISPVSTPPTTVKKFALFLPANGIAVPVQISSPPPSRLMVKFTPAPSS